jgi:hypothetical protein
MPHRKELDYKMRVFCETATDWHNLTGHMAYRGMGANVAAFKQSMLRTRVIT